MRSTRVFLLAALLSLPLLAVLQGCGDIQGDLDENRAPSVQFVNVHDNSDSLVYDFAPIIHWSGSDPDGFIEYYSYADVTDSAAIENPIEYIPRVPEETWVDTIATQARIYLLTEAGDTTEHVFYVRAEDNKGMQSDIIYRRFRRSNNAPYIPRIGITGSDESLFDTRYVVEDTLFSAPEITNIYPGIQFSWRGSDPDDKALFSIPLEYQAVLVKAPSDTVFVNPWTDEVEIQLVNLETGFYTLNVWARDDGLTKSVAPARAEFNVIRPTFEHNLLVALESPIQGFNGEIQNPPTRDAVQSYYEDLLAEVAPNVTMVNLDLSDGIDVRYFRLTSPSQTIPRSLIHQYKLVVFAADHLNSEFPWGGTGDDDYMDRKQEVLDDYLRVGGRVWQTGRTLWRGGMFFNPQQNPEGAQLLEDFFGVDSLSPPPNDAGNNPYRTQTFLMRADFIKTFHGLPSFPDLQFDSSKTDENGFINGQTGEPFGYWGDDFGMSGVDRIARNEDATTTQYFVSRTFGTEVEVEDEDSHVLPTGTNAIDDEFEDVFFPPTSTNAYLVTKNNNVDQITSIINWTFQQEGRSNDEAEVVVISDDLVRVSYSEGQPWSDSDSLQVDYIYNPISVMHLKPVEVRREGVQGGSQINPFPALRFRTALTTFSYYFIEQEDAVTAWVQMLNWFYNPAIFDF